MATTDSSLGGQRALRESDLDELRSEVFRLALWAALGLALILFWTLVVPHGTADPVADRIFVLALVFAIAGVVWVAAESRAHASLALRSSFLVAGLGLILTAAFFAQRDERLAYWFSLLVILSGSLLGGRAIVLAAGFACAVLAVATGSAGILSFSYAFTAALFTVFIATVSWLIAKPTYTALEWSRTSYRQALEKTEQLRDQQVELMRTSEKLKRANDRLEQVNRELARAREAAEEARRLKAQFAANVSHELRTPLNHIVGFADLMMTAPETYGVPLPRGYQEDIEAIHRSARHLSRLIDDVLDLSQVDAGRMGLAKEKADLAEIVHEAVGTVSGLFVSRGLSLGEELAVDLPPVYVDRTRIRQVIINLLGNAARFTPQGGATVSARVEGSDVLVNVTDTGLGITEGDRVKVFEEFRQLDGSTSRRQEGSGLGLAICKRFIDLHGGSIWVESTPGQGSSFCFTLPVSGSHSTLAFSQGGPGRLGRSSGEAMSERTLAVVASDPAFPKLLQRYLDGFHVLSAANAGELRQMLLEQSAEAMVIASGSADEGRQQLGELRAVVGDIPVAICPLPRRRGALQQSGFAGRLVKPVSRDQLLRRLRALGGQVHTVLVVDDDPDTLRLLARMLSARPLRCRVEVASGGEEALAMLPRVRPDVVLLDLAMPDLDGYGVVRRMREGAGADIPVIAVTGRDDPEEAMIVDALLLTRGDGLAAGELIPCLGASLNALLALPSSGRAPGGGQPG